MARHQVLGICFDHVHMGDLLRLVANHPDAEIAGIYDPDPARMRGAIATFAIPPERVFTDLDACLATPGADLAIVCSKTAERATMVEAIAPHGLNVMVEKPFAPSVADARRMIKAMAATGKRLAVNWPLAWYPSHNTAKRLVAEGRIGDLVEVHFYDGNRGPLFHLADKVEVSPAEVERQKPGSWWYKKSAGGGSLLDYLGYGVTLGTWFYDGAVVEPGAEGDAIAEIVEEAAAAGRLLVPPRAGLLALDLRGADLDLVGEMKERPAIAVVEMDLDEVADPALGDEALGGVVRGIPGERPVDGEALAGRGHRLDHPPRVGDAWRERLLHHHVQAVRGDGLDHGRPLGGLGADDGEIGTGGRETRVEVGEDALGRDREGRDRPSHPRRVGIVDAGDLGIRMVGDQPQQIAHVDVVEADPEHLVARHVPSSMSVPRPGAAQPAV